MVSERPENDPKENPKNGKSGPNGNRSNENQLLSPARHFPMNPPMNCKGFLSSSPESKENGTGNHHAHHGSSRYRNRRDGSLSRTWSPGTWCIQPVYLSIWFRNFFRLSRESGWSYCSFFAEGQQNPIDLVSFSSFWAWESIKRSSTILPQISSHRRAAWDKFGLLYQQHRRLDILQIKTLNSNKTRYWVFWTDRTTNRNCRLFPRRPLVNTPDRYRPRPTRSHHEKSQREDLTVPHELLTLSTLDLLLYGLTSNQVGAVVILSAIASEVLSLVNPRTAQEIADNISF